MKQHKRIVFVTPSLKTGGGNRVFVELANQLCSKYEVLIVSPNNSPETHTFLCQDNVKIKVIGKLAKDNAVRIANILRIIHCINVKYRKDTIIFSDPLFSLFSLFLRGKNLFRFIQADDYRIFDDGGILGKGIILEIYKVFCIYSYGGKKIKYIFNSSYVYKRFSEDSGRKLPFLIVHPALNHDIFNPVNRKAENSGIAIFNICLVARKHPWKGLETFINTYREMDDVYKNKIGEVYLISHDDLSAFNTEGMKIIKPKSDKEIASIYRKSDIFISTSWWEGFGLPPLEAMACGCTVITSDSGGVKEYAKDEENCLMFEPKNEIQLKERLIELINNRDLQEKLSQNGIETAKNFSWEKSSGQIEIIIANC